MVVFKNYLALREQLMRFDSLSLGAYLFVNFNIAFVTRVCIHFFLKGLQVFVFLNRVVQF